MTLDYNQSISISKLIKALIATGNPTKKQSLANKITIGGEPLSPHSFRLDDSLTVLTYEVERHNGETFVQNWYLETSLSNLPNNKKSVRYYLISRGRRIAKLHCYAFTDCVCLFSRHDYKHIYRSQSYSKQQRGLKHHDYRRKIESLVNSKKKLTLKYQGKPTRTAKRLNYYEEQEEYYDDLANERLMAAYLSFL